MLITDTRLCLACSKELRGRTDKKFCDDYCRNHFNNLQRSGDNNFIRNVINALRKNRLILQDLLGDKLIVKIHMQRLLTRGFQFKYHTDTYPNKKGGQYYYCFEYGYLPLEQDYYLLVKRRIPTEKEV